MLGKSVNNPCEYCFVSLAEPFRCLIQLLNLQLYASDGEVKARLQWTWRSHSNLYAVSDRLIISLRFPFFRKSF
jgi:hypothetical protein